MPLAHSHVRERPDILSTTARVVTGWESDQVIKGANGEPDTSIPITWACESCTTRVSRAVQSLCACVLPDVRV